MANSVVKVTDAVDDKISDSLLLLVGEDGTVTPDRQTVEQYLNVQHGPTNLQIMHIDKCDTKGIDVTIDNVTYVPDNMDATYSGDVTAKDETKDNLDIVAFNLHNIRLDHDYTFLTVPEKTSPAVVEEDDELAKTLSILHGNEVMDTGEPTTESAPAQNVRSNKINIISNISLPTPRTSTASTSPTKETTDAKEAEKVKATKAKKVAKVVAKEPAPEKAAEKSDVKPLESKPDKELEKKIPKKKKEPPKPIPGDFALFSTPDIIRKVGAKEPATPTPASEPSAAPKPPKTASDQGKIKTDTPPPSRPAKITSESRSKSSSDSSLKTVSDEKEKHPRSSSTDSRPKDRRDSGDKLRHSKSVDEKSSSSKSTSDERRFPEASSERKIDHVGKERRASEPTSKVEGKHTKSDQIHGNESQEVLENTAEISNILMPQDATPAPPVTDIQPNAHDQSGINLDVSGLDLDPSILDNINNDVISDDILYRVAQQLVSNTELQNAIDKGINEGVLDASSIQEAMNMSEMSNTSLNASISEVQRSDVIKEGTQIVRPDGRIVILPPIERPTTRSRNKKKEETEVVKPSFKEDKKKERPAHKPLDEEHVSGNELDSSNDEEEQAEQTEEDEVEDEEESEDDPNKLWCICNQPHNNRFMICCDTCEEWYHGKCVNITKAMGQQMEAEGKEWICLYCRDSNLKRPAAAARRIRKASRNSRQSTDSGGGSSVKRPNKAAAPPKGGSTPATLPCVVCQKPARKNSIYCSESCILTHAQGVEKVVVFERSTGHMLTGNKAPSAPDLDQWLKEHPGYEVVRSGGKVVTTKAKTGQMTQSKLKIVKNPNNHGVSLAVLQKGVKVGLMKHSLRQAEEERRLAVKSGKIIKMIHRGEIKESKAKLIQPPPFKSKEQTTPVKPKAHVQTLLAPKTPSTATTPPVKVVKKEAPPKEVKKTPKPRTRDDQQSSQTKAEDIRDNVQKTIYEQLNVRLKDSDIKLQDEEVKNISIEIEGELYKCFGDTNQKYKNKYRSLIFNIKDPKNQTLWRRICEKSISSYQLVRLSPDDMASQELAKWREQEAKHQLDMIKKSEIELLNCNRQYVLKTHKGEEVLEDNRPNKVDNTEMIKSLTEGSTLDTGPDGKRGQDKDKSGSKHRHKDKTRDKDRHTSRDRRNKEHKSRRSSSRERDRSKRSRSDDKSKHKKKDKPSSRSRSRDKDKDKDKYRKSSHKSSKSKKPGAPPADNLDKRSKEILEQLHKYVPPAATPALEDRLWKHVPQDDIVPNNASLDSDSDHEVPTSTVTIPTPPQSLEVEEATSIQSTEDSKPTSKAPPNKETTDVEVKPSLSPQPVPAQIWAGTINMVDVAQISITAHEVSGDCSGLSKELSENLDIVGRISPDTVWDYIGKMRSSNSKTISMIRLNATNMEEQMPYLMLYSYLSSRNRLGVVKSTNKAIKDFYILPLAAQQPIPQALLPISGPVRAWLEATVKKITRIQFGFEEARPSVLLGIIVRDKRKRTYLEPAPQQPSPLAAPAHKKQRIEVHVIQTPASRSYTPPPMPAELPPATLPPLPVPTPKVDPRLAKLAVLPPPPVAPLPDMDISETIPALDPVPGKSPNNAIGGNDDDEPYSPEDSDPDTTGADTMPVSSILSTSMSLGTAITDTYTPIPGLEGGTDLKLNYQRQMEELNKEIEMQKSEITSITKNIATSADSDIVGSALASIALPSNLQQILDSIKTIGSNTNSNESKESTFSGHQETSPIHASASDLTIPLMIPKTFSRPLTTSDSNTIPLNLPTKAKPAVNSPLPLEDRSTSVLSKLSEEELIKKAAEMLRDVEDEEAASQETRRNAMPPLPPPAPCIQSRVEKQKSKMDVTLPPVPGIDD